MEVTRLFDPIRYQNEKYPQKISFAHMVNGSWVEYSTQKIIDLANKVSLGLLNLGLQPGEKVATIIEQNRTEWTITDLGITQIGGINVPVYPTITEADFEFIFNHAEVKICFVSSAALYNKVKNLIGKVDTLQAVYTWDQVAGAKNWNEVMQLTLTQNHWLP